MGLAHLLLDFFHNGFLVGNTIRPYSLRDFIKKYPQFGHRPHDVSSYCRRLENEHLLDHMGTTSGSNPYYVHHYYTNKAFYDEQLSVYGSYDMLVEGFLSVRNRFFPLVLPLSVMIESGDLSIGSSFVYTKNLVITARHCLEGVKKIDLLNKDGQAIQVSRVFFPSDERIDIAVIELAAEEFIEQQTHYLARKGGRAR